MEGTGSKLCAAREAANPMAAVPASTNDTIVRLRPLRIVLISRRKGSLARVDTPGAD
jgi:hypothetical protein